MADIREITERMDTYRKRLSQAFEWRIEQYRRRLAELQKRLAQSSPRQQLFERRMRQADLQNRFSQAMKDKLEDRKNRLALLAERLHGLSPLLKLQQGYSYTEGQDGRAVTRIDQAAEGEKLKIHVTDGMYTAVVESRTRLKRG